MPEQAPLILCVDDNESARSALARMLERAGFRTAEAATGIARTAEAATGIAGLQQMAQRPDLVVLASHLPDIDGYEICQRIKADPETASTPVLQISADFVDAGHRTLGLELGADAYLAPPVEPPQLIATIRCLLRARRAEEQTRRMARELQSTFDAVSDALCLLDRDGRAVRCNQAMTRLLGKPEHELIGRSHESFFGPPDHGQENVPFRRMVASRRRESRDIQRGDRWLRVTCDPVVDEHGQLSGAVCILSDRTERQKAQLKREQLLAREQQGQRDAQLGALEASESRFRKLEQELRENVVELEAADQRKDEFLAMLAHELRNPLAAVTMGVHVLEQIGSPDPKALETRATILRQIGILTRLVDDLLDVSRITRGKVELRKEPVLAREAVQHALATSRPLLDERRHSVSLEISEEPVWVSADPTRLEQVLWNLVNNAAKYTEPGGHISVSLRREGGEAVFRVRDTGIGIEPAMLERIFELFAQADQSPARSRGGLGVGLTLVKRLVEMHDGNIRARSEGLYKGAEFEVRLPLLREEVLRADRPTAPLGPLRRRLLLVEDNPDIGEMMRDLLQLLGHRVELAGDGLRGVQLALALRPEVMLVDIGLPGIDGYEVARRLRATDAGKDMILVALTGYGRPEDRDRALASGFDAHLVKPVDPDELTRLLASLAPSCRQPAGQA